MKTGQKIALLIAVAALAGAALATRPLLGAKTPPTEKPRAEQRAENQGLPVSLTPARKLAFVDSVKTQGNVESVRQASVTAKFAGTLEAIYVDEGEAVIVDKTKLFKLDSLKLEKTLDIRRHELAVARYSLKEKQAGLEQIDASLDKAKLDYKRYRRLKASETVSTDALEQQESKYRQILASRKYTLAVIDLAAEQVRQAQAGLAIAKKDVQDAIVLAPISGVVSHRLQEPGERATTSDPVVKIEDTRLLDISALIPARHYARVIPGQTGVEIRVHGLKLGRLPVRYKSPTIDSSMRTFEIKCRLENPEGKVAPGAMAEMEVILRTENGLGVPREAVVIRNGKPMIFSVVKDRARMIEVTTGLETDGWLEVRAEDLSEGLAIVTAGQDRLNPGDKIRAIGKED